MATRPPKTLGSLQQRIDRRHDQTDRRLDMLAHEVSVLSMTVHALTRAINELLRIRQPGTDNGAPVKLSDGE